MAKANQFTLEITTTALCDMDCTYCFEGVKVDKQRLDDKVDVLKQRIHEFLEHPWFQKNYDLLNISFWGGEPTLNHDLIVDIITEFQERDDVSFHIYSNGHNRNRMDKIVDNVDLSKLQVQISYDGKEINDIFRILPSGKPTSSKVIENVEYFARKGVNISMKATIPLKSMMDVYPVWKDYEQLYYKLNSIGDNITIVYAPTIDYVNDIPREELTEMIDVFRTSMLKIAKEEIEFYKNHGHFLCTWFNGSEAKIHCTSGVHMHAIDVDGNSYACHGSLYSPNKREMKGGNIQEDSFINNIIKMSNTLSIPIAQVSDVCKDCVATTCMICPVVSLDQSEKEDFADRWTDRWVTNMCGFYKAFGEIDRTVMEYVHTNIKTKREEE
jgi:uncharacterized protein